MLKLTGRVLALAVLLVCLAQLGECLKLPGMKSKTAEEKAEEERWKAAKDAYKRLFVRSGKLTTEEVLEKLAALNEYHGREDLDFPVDTIELIEFAEPKEEKCDDRAYVEKLRQFAKTTKRQYVALRDYATDALAKQVALCNYEDRFKHVVEQFKSSEPDKWQLIEEYNYAVGQNGLRESDWKGKTMDNTWQMNEALSNMFDDKVHYGHYQGNEIGFKSYNLARELIEACKSFSDRVGASLLMTTYNPNIKENEEMLDWLRYLNVCGQVERTNFERAISTMFNKQYMPGANDIWGQYMEWRELWV